jgi:glycosyltransferase involved in cell wall biosynthesis
VDVLVPAYRAARFIGETLVSISTQTFQDIRVIVSVDLSDDATYDICADFAKRDPRFRVVEQNTRLGWMGNFNYLLNQATAEYALIVGHDDLVATDYVEKLHAVINSLPGVALCYTDIEVANIDGSRTHWSYKMGRGLHDPVQRASWVLRSSGWWVAYRGMFRVAEARQTGGLKPHGSGEYGGELPWLLHMSLLGEFARVPETLYFKHIQQDGMTVAFDATPSSRRRNADLALACWREARVAALSAGQRRRLAVPLVRRFMRGAITDFLPTRLRWWLHHRQAMAQARHR